MIELLGTDIWHRIERIPQIRSCKPSMLKIIAEKLKTDPIGQQIAMLYKTIIHGNGGMLLGDIIEIFGISSKRTFTVLCMCM